MYGKKRSAKATRCYVMITQHLLSYYIFTFHNLSNCNTFTVRRFILLSFKHQTHKPTAISVEHNQWEMKHKTSKLQATFTARSDLSTVTVTYIVEYKDIIWQGRLCGHNVTTSCVRGSFLAVQSMYELNRSAVCLYSCFRYP